MQSDVDKRMTAEEFLAHRFITSSNEEYSRYLEAIDPVRPNVREIEEAIIL